MIIEKRDILTVSRHEGVIAHQCNCTSGYSAGVANAIFEKWPYADIYSSRKKPDIPGTMHMAVPPEGSDGPVIFNLLAQVFPGRPHMDSPARDTKEARVVWMQRSLEKIFVAEHPLIPSVRPLKIYVPFGMGCGLAGGDWLDYSALLVDMETEDRIFVACKKP